MKNLLMLIILLHGSLFAGENRDLIKDLEAVKSDLEFLMEYVKRGPDGRSIQDIKDSIDSYIEPVNAAYVNVAPFEFPMYSGVRFLPVRYGKEIYRKGLMIEGNSYRISSGSILIQIGSTMSGCTGEVGFVLMHNREFQKKAYYRAMYTKDDLAAMGPSFIIEDVGKFRIGIYSENDCPDLKVEHLSLTIEQWEM